MVIIVIAWQKKWGRIFVIMDRIRMNLIENVVKNQKKKKSSQFCKLTLLIYANFVNPCVNIWS